MQMYNTHGQTGETHLINFNGQNWLSGSVTAARHRIEKHGRFNAYFIESLEASNRHVVRRHIWWIRFTYWKNTSFRSGGNSPDIWRFRNGTTMERINLKWQLTRWIRMKLKIKKRIPLRTVGVFTVELQWFRLTSVCAEFWLRVSSLLNYSWNQLWESISIYENVRRKTSFIFVGGKNHCPRCVQQWINLIAKYAI